MIDELLVLPFIVVADALRHLVRVRRLHAARRLLQRRDVTERQITDAIANVAMYDDLDARELRARLGKLRVRLFTPSLVPPEETAEEDLRTRRVSAARRVLERSNVADSEIVRVLTCLLAYDDPEARELRRRLSRRAADLSDETRAG